MMNTDGYKTKKSELINKIIGIEWEMFSKVNNIGGRASCQDDFPTFNIMRDSQFQAWSMECLESYENDLTDAVADGINVVELKYAYMMEYTHSDYFNNNILPFIPKIDDEKKSLINKIVSLSFDLYNDVKEKHSQITSYGRPIVSDNCNQVTSIEVYLRGELATYSKQTLEKLLSNISSSNSNYILQIYKNTASHYGYSNIDILEKG